MVAAQDGLAMSTAQPIDNALKSGVFLILTPAKATDHL
jgi:hypothetical protein